MKKTIYKDLEFNKVGQIIRGRLYMPDAHEQKWPLVIFAHGFGSCFAELEHYGPILAEAGIACLLFDFCGGSQIGTSDGSMEKMSVLTEIDDMETVLKGAIRMPQIDTNAVFLMGESLGGVVAACTAAAGKVPVSGLILWYPGFGIGRDCERRSRMTGPEKYDFFDGQKLSNKFIHDGTALDIYQAIKDYKGPVQIIHGEADPIVPVILSKEAVNLFAQAKLLMIPGAVHGFEGDERMLAIQTTIDFVNAIVV